MRRNRSSLTRPRGRVLLLPLLLLALFAPPALWAAGPEAGLPRLLFALAAMLAGAKVMGDLAERIGQPAVLGELLAGVLLGKSLLGIVPAAGQLAEQIHILAELGVLLLLFEIGLETDLKEMFRVGKASATVAAVGVVLPLALGYGYWVYVPHPASASTGSLTNTAIFIGATLTATSVGITARVLSDLGRMHAEESRIILGAAVIDDILGLVLLSVVSALASGAALSVLGVGRILGVAFGFVAVALIIGIKLAPSLFNLVDRMRGRHALFVFAFVFALGLAALAEVAGSALIIGAFAAGLVLSHTNQFDVIEREIRPVAAVFTPIFFVSVGAAVDVRLLNPFAPGAGGTLLLAGVLTLLALAGKLVTGWTIPWRRVNRLAIGLGMVPRGEVGLIFADIGRRAGLLSEDVFSAVLVMVMVTTFIAPIGLKSLWGRGGEEPGPPPTASPS